MNKSIAILLQNLPDAPAAERFLAQLEEKHPAASGKLHKNTALLSDVMTLVSFSPLLATTLLQNPDYFLWLNRKRKEPGVRSVEEILESLARFSLTNSQIEPAVVFARFRRRELLRIYLKDIRRLATIAEITEEISNLADAILESALKVAGREMENRYGTPQFADDKGKTAPARFVIGALGKLGSRELNYSSDIDLIFIYSNEGMTAGNGKKAAVTNREYFGKLAEHVSRLVGGQRGGEAAYRVDLRLRPHGSLGALAVSLTDFVRYYEQTARPWERQVLIRSRAASGDAVLWREFWAHVEDVVFSDFDSPANALENVRRSKEKIDREQKSKGGYDVKLGHGGIREIEFIAQALQLAHGGGDRWLRVSHTLISLTRLADRGHITSAELSNLSDAYTFLRRTEHILQMENGIQTHIVPFDSPKRALLAARVIFTGEGSFDAELDKHCSNVSRVFARIFDSEWSSDTPVRMAGSSERSADTLIRTDSSSGQIDAVSIQVETTGARHAGRTGHADKSVRALGEDMRAPDYTALMIDAVRNATNHAERLAAMRQIWRRCIENIIALDKNGTISLREAKDRQNKLAEASITAAIEAAGGGDSTLAVLALGKLGSRTLDYGSDLDLILVHDGSQDGEFYSRVVEAFVNSLSAMTRDGSLYRVDLRLRPYGSKGLSSMPAEAFLEYMREKAEVWEMLAFVKLRAAGGNMALATQIEDQARRIIHERAQILPEQELKEETRRVRLALQDKKGRIRRSSDIDIKYGSGALLDIYFAGRYLQLRDDVRDFGADRSTPVMLGELLKRGSLTSELHRDLLAGHEFLSNLDHALRLSVGRTTRLPLGNQNTMQFIAERLKFGSVQQLLEELTLHRLSIRAAFDSILG